MAVAINKFKSSACGQTFQYKMNDAMQNESVRRKCDQCSSGAGIAMVLDGTFDVFAAHECVNRLNGAMVGHENVLRQR